MMYRLNGLREKATLWGACGPEPIKSSRRFLASLGMTVEENFYRP